MNMITMKHLKINQMYLIYIYMCVCVCVCVCYTGTIHSVTLFSMTPVKI